MIRAPSKPEKPPVEKGTQGILAVDPGLRNCGVAVFSSGGKLLRAWCSHNRVAGGGPASWFPFASQIFFEIQSVGVEIDRAAFEIPQIYRVSPGDPNDLIDVAAVAAAVGSQFALVEAFGFKPREWKANVPKEIHGKRILSQLASDEVATITEKRVTFRHNAVDAVGIGLFLLDRLGIRRRTVAPVEGGK